MDDSHDDARGSHVRTETLADSRHFPENASESRLAAVQKRRIERMNVRTRAHKKQKHNQNALKVEKCRHREQEKKKKKKPLTTFFFFFSKLKFRKFFNHNPIFFYLRCLFSDAWMTVA